MKFSLKKIFMAIFIAIIILGIFLMIKQEFNIYEGAVLSGAVQPPSTDSSGNTSRSVSTETESSETVSDTQLCTMPKNCPVGTTTTSILKCIKKKAKKTNDGYYLCIA